MLESEQVAFVAIYVIAAAIYLLTQKRHFPLHYLVKAAPIIILLFVAVNAAASVRIWVMFALLFSAAAIIPLAFITLFALYLVRKLYPTLGGLRIPVLCYIGVLIAMGVTSSLHAPFNWLLVVGAILFMLSDASIAIHKFLHPIPGRDFIVMSTYYVAQFLLVMGFVL